MTGRERRQGIILVTVLWSVALLSALAMAASVTFREFAGVMAVARDRVQAEALLTAGLEAAAGLLATPDLRILAESETGLTLSTGSVRVRLSDEGGRIDIGKAPVEVIAALLRQVGAPEEAADSLARRIIERRNADAAERAAPLRRTSQAYAADTPFSSVRQLADIPGMAADWVTAMAPLTTVFGGETVNPLTAPAGVIAALPGVDARRLAAFLAMRASASPDDAGQLQQLLEPAQNYLTIKPPRATSVEMTARLPDGYTAAARAVIVVLPKDSQPYRVLHWQPL